MPMLQYDYVRCRRKLLRKDNCRVHLRDYHKERAPKTKRDGEYIYETYSRFAQRKLGGWWRCSHCVARNRNGMWSCRACRGRCEEIRRLGCVRADAPGCFSS